MSKKTLRNLFVEELQDIHDAEQRLTKALPKLAKAADSEELSNAFEEHLRETQEHVIRLERVMKSIDESPGRKTCKAMVGLLEEGDELMEEDGPPAVKDAALIAAAQKVEHYEIATYGCLRAWADLLDEPEASRLLQQTLDEEGAADQKLSEIAESLNVEAAEDEDEEEGEEKEQAVASRRSNGRSRTAQKSRSR